MFTITGSYGRSPYPFNFDGYYAYYVYSGGDVYSDGGSVLSNSYGNNYFSIIDMTPT